MSRTTSAGRSRENTRERLLASAVDVFVAKGLKRVTVDDLVGAAGFTRGAFYSNFSSVDEVFFEVFRRRATGMVDQARALISSAPEAEFGVEFVASVVETLSGSGREWLVLHNEFTLLALRDEEARDLLAEFSQQMRGEIVELIGDVLTRLGRRPTLPVAQVAEIVLALQSHGQMLTSLGDTRLGAEVAWDGVRIMQAVITAFSEELPAS